MAIRRTGVALVVVATVVLAATRANGFAVVLVDVDGAGVVVVVLEEVVVVAAVVVLVVVVVDASVTLELEETADGVTVRVLDRMVDATKLSIGPVTSLNNGLSVAEMGLDVLGDRARKRTVTGSVISSRMSFVNKEVADEMLMRQIETSRHIMRQDEWNGAI